MAITKSSRLFQERHGLRPTYRSPAPTMNPSRNEMHDTPLEPPLPMPETLSNGDPPPDRGGTTEPWPHGVPPVQVSDA